MNFNKAGTAFLNRIIVFIFLFAAFSSCKKGDMGPAGINGIDGNANVKTDKFSIASEEWIYNSIYWIGTSGSVSQGQVSKYYERVNNAITDSILDMGAVLVYVISNNSLQEWTPLPLTWMDNFTGNYTYNYAFVPTKGKLTIHFFFAKVAGNAVPTLSTFVLPPIKVKVICIDSKLGLSAAQVNRLQQVSYSEAKSILHLHE